MRSAVAGPPSPTASLALDNDTPLAHVFDTIVTSIFCRIERAVNEPLNVITMMLHTKRFLYFLRIVFFLMLELHNKMGAPASRSRTAGWRASLCGLYATRHDRRAALAAPAMSLRA